MALKTVEQYKQSLKDGRVVYWKGQRIEDVTEHHYIKRGMGPCLNEYIMSQDPRYTDLLCDRDEKGELFSFVFKPARSVEDLLRRRKITQTLFRAGGGSARFTGIDALHAMTAASYRMDEAMGTSYSRQVEAFRDYCLKTDPTVVVAMTDPKGDRSLRPSKQQQHQDYYLRIVNQTKDGIVVRGAKAHISFAPFANEVLVMPCRNMPTEADKDYAVAFAIPVNTKGVSLIFPAPEPAEEDNPFDFPLSSAFASSDAIVVFDDVFIPIERVFMKGEWQYSGNFTYMFGNFHRLSADAYKAVELEILVGVAALMAEYNGLERASHILEKLSWLMWYAESTDGLGLAAAQNCLFDPSSGMAYPNPMLSNAAKFFFAENYHQAIKLVQDIAGGIVVTCPSREDFLNPETRDVLEKYLGGKAGVPTEDRIRAIKLVRELGSTFHAVSTLHAEGSLFAQKLSFYALGEWNRYKTAAKRAAGIPLKEEETHPLYQGLPNFGRQEGSSA